ncbi:MAG: ribonuclease P protein component 4 [Candidatus Nanohaloarchaea archaeon]
MTRDIARERIHRLFDLADRRFSEERDDAGELADRYVELAREIGMSYNVSIPGELRRRYCHECGSFLEPGANCTVRLNSKNSTVNYHCEKCGEVNRYGFES